MDLEFLHNIPFDIIKKIAKEFSIKGKDKEQLITQIIDKHNKLQKYIDYTFIKQLGFEGKDGRTFLAKDSKNKKVAIKFFKEIKSSKLIQKEAELQSIASQYNISPKVLTVNIYDKFIAMELCDKTLYDILKEQNGSLTLSQQKEILNIFKVLDECKVFHRDPNVVNFMTRKGKLNIIDFGFAIPINNYCINRYGTDPNQKYMVTGLLIKLQKLFPNQKYKLLDNYKLIN
jgi:serine/threonine protein kinase